MNLERRSTDTDMTAGDDPPAARSNRPPSWTVSTLIEAGLIVVLEESDSRLVVSLVPAWAGGPSESRSLAAPSPDDALGLSIAVGGEASARRAARARGG